MGVFLCVCGRIEREFVGVFERVFVGYLSVCVCGRIFVCLWAYLSVCLWAYLNVCSCDPFCVRHLISATLNHFRVIAITISRT